MIEEVEMVAAYKTAEAAAFAILGVFDVSSRGFCRLTGFFRKRKRVRKNTRMS